jgi:hypothetical protein
LIVMTLLLGLLLAVGGCADDEDDTPPALSISGTWRVQGEPNRSFEFASEDDGQDAGTFVGMEATASGGSAAVAGSWADGRVFFTVQRDGGITYSGTFLKDNPTQLPVSSVLELLTLLRGN